MKAKEKSAEEKRKERRERCRKRDETGAIGCRERRERECEAVE